MTIETFRKKRKNIKQTHPAPDGMNDAQKVRFHSKIAFEWIEQLNEVDVKTALKEERALIRKKMTSAV